MQDILISVFIFCIASSQLLGTVYSKTTFNVVKFGAVGDGQTDDTEVTSLSFNCVYRHLTCIGFPSSIIFFR